ncbi:MAG: prephenate dehydrogenase/arogenate dehydrogenase family protein, partial [Candidatus Levybacteria bacterium]|nr:prephenate dehydrogenase/arogenate dehydrogenase family protein [Candidatus Levybacteria bacterium]
MKKKITIHIIGGRGKMGQWFVQFFKDHDLEVTVSNRDFSAKKNLINKADIVMISVPIADTPAVIEAVIPLMNQKSLLTDITSVKVLPMQAMENAACGTLGMHPLFGPTIGSVIGQKIIFCRQNDNEHVAFLQNIFEKAGFEVIEMSAEEQDYQVAYIQALTHATHLLYAKALLGQEKEILTKLQTPTFALHALTMGRVLNQDVDLMADMQFYNPYFLPVYDSLLENAQSLSKILQTGDKNAFKEFFKEEIANAKRFSSLSVFQTNKLLRVISEIPTHLPSKPRITNMPQDVRVAFLGPNGTYSQQAATSVFPKAKAYIPETSIYTTFQSVLSEKADVGVVPAENSLEGIVRNTIDYLVEFSLFVCGSFAIPIHHQLLSKEKKLSSITTIVSHPQALAQCKKWIREKLPHASIISTESTTQSLLEIKKGYGYIASTYAAGTYAIPVLAKNIEDTLTNTTRFYVIAKTPLLLKGLHTNNTLLFVTVYNRVGILKDILSVLAVYNLNLLKLESR